MIDWLGLLPNYFWIAKTIRGLHLRGGIHFFVVSIQGVHESECQIKKIETGRGEIQWLSFPLYIDLRVEKH